MRRYLIPFFASPHRQRNSIDASSVELQQYTTESTESKQQAEQQQHHRRGHGLYLHLSQAPEGLDREDARDDALIGGSEMLHGQQEQQ